MEQIKRKRGFASLSPEKRREISSKGGRAATEKGVAHRFTSEEAKVAGSKGGSIVSQDRAHMAEIGRKGGSNRNKAKTTTVTNENTLG